MSRQRKLFWVMTICVMGLGMRLLVATLGGNFDLESWYIVAEIKRFGGNVYLETTRYNYAPFWSELLRIVHILTYGIDQPWLFRYFLTIILTLADLATAWVIWKRISYFAAGIFFLNPISIIISGYHLQFDTIAIAIMLVTFYWYDRNEGEKSFKKTLIASIGIGLSLCFKHVFIFFPLWWALKETKWMHRIIIILLPLCIFGISFTPFLPEAWPDIRTNVIGYQYKNNGILYNHFLPE